MSHHVQFDERFAVAASRLHERARELVRQAADVRDPAWSPEGWSRSLDEYAERLALLHGFVAPAELAARATLIESGWEDLIRAGRLPALESDLRYLGLSPARLPRLPVTHCQRLGDAIAWVYAMDALVPRADAVARRLERELGLSARHGAAFVNACAEGDGGVRHLTLERLVDAERRGEGAAMIAKLSSLKTGLHAWRTGRLPA